LWNYSLENLRQYGRITKQSLSSEHTRTPSDRWSISWRIGQASLNPSAENPKKDSQAMERSESRTRQKINLLSRVQTAIARTRHSKRAESPRKPW
jgi:hypothetical protein